MALTSPLIIPVKVNQGPGLDGVINLMSSKPLGLELVDYSPASSAKFLQSSRVTDALKRLSVGVHHVAHHWTRASASAAPINKLKK